MPEAFWYNDWKCRLTKYIGHGVSFAGSFFFLSLMILGSWWRRESDVSSTFRKAEWFFWPMISSSLYLGKFTHIQGSWFTGSGGKDRQLERVTHLREVIPVQVEVVTCGGRCTRGAALKQIQDIGTRRYVLSVDNENGFRSRCEWISVLGLQPKIQNNQNREEKKWKKIVLALK